jgi:hypothetical protein
MHAHLPYDWLLSAAALYVYSAAIQSLPTPEATERWYGALYRFLHYIGANFKLAAMLKPPDSEAK